MNRSIKTYLNENWNHVELGYNKKIPDNGGYWCYWWKEYMNFNVFLYDGTFAFKIDIICHERDKINPKRPIGYKHYFKKYEDWINFDFKQFKLMINDLELYDKKLSIKKKLNTIKKDF